MSQFERTDQLARLVDRKHDILHELRELSRRQLQIVESSDMNRLLTVLSAKQLLLKDLQTVERQLDPFRPEDPERRQWRSAQDRQRCRQVAERCESLLRETMLMEQRSEAVLVQRRDQAAARLDEAHDASEARQAYSQTQSSRPSRIDLSTQ